MRLTFHVGPHKTGATYINRMLQHNQDRFAPYAPVIPRNAPEFEAILNVVRSFRTRDDVMGRANLLTKTARMFGETVATRGGIVSHPDVLGPLPTTAGVKGLYPFADLVLELIADGLAEAGLQVCFVLYLRNSDAWLHALFQHRFAGQSRAFAPRKFRARNDLPANWKELRGRLHGSLNPGELQLLRYDQEAAKDRLGTELFHLAGLPRAKIAALDWLDPSQPASPRPRRRLGSMI